MKRKIIMSIVYTGLSITALFLAFIIYYNNLPREVEIKTHANSNAKQATKILFIGNSLTYGQDMPNLFVKIYRLLYSDAPLVVESATGPGFTLREHLSNDKTHEALKQYKWDYVILQEGTQSAYNRQHESLDSFRRLLKISKTPGCKPLGVMITTDRGQFWWQARLSQFFRSVGKELNMPILPLGDVCSFSQMRHPDLNLHAQDQHHLSQAGSLLYACMVIRAIKAFPPATLADKISKTQPDPKDGLTAYQLTTLTTIAKILGEWDQEGANSPIYTQVSDDRQSSIGEYWLRHKKYDEAVAMYQQQNSAARKLFEDRPTAALGSSYWNLADAIIQQQKYGPKPAQISEIKRASDLLSTTIEIYKKSGAFNTDAIEDAEGYKRDLDEQFGIESSK
ncbi:MAG: SGNH/GDSL hydrolase family protein [Candidatus Obscuribacter sp.]|nr:SGNH/GDSL hydrolase family protein [Candidatus Obscuribacter sp.]